MSFLPRLPFRNQLHDDALGDHERELLPHAGGDAHGVHDQSARYIVQADEDRVGEEERFQGALHPLVREGVGETGRLRHQRAGEAGDPFGAHGVALVRHGGGPDLVLLEWLLHLFLRYEMANVPTNLLRGGAEACDGAGDYQVHLVRVHLGGHVVAG